MEKNKICISIIFILVIIVSSIIVYPDFGSDTDASGCCINPKTPIVPCNSDIGQISLKNVCCRDPAIYTSYYYSAEQPWGPSNYDICKNNYFVVNTDCSGVSNCTISGCCCITTGDGWEERKKFECYGDDVVEWKAGTPSECPSLCAIPECTTPQECRDNEPYCSVQDCCGVGSLNPGICDPMENAENCPADCGAACTPSLSSLQINSVKGEKKLELSWGDGCSGIANYYIIERCPGSGCTNFQQIAQSASRYFVDSSNELLWNSDYRYRITASYNTLSATPSIEGSKTTGNLECWYQYSSNFFCINAPYYYSYQDYMSANSLSPNGNYYNKAYYCDTGNLLRPQGKDCGTQNVCIVEDNTPECLASADCKIETTPLGLYGNKPSCETGNYCFFDKSYSLVDTCYSCKTDMSCYDYKSQSACATDNCAVGSCGWSSTMPSIGIGVCASAIKSNCEWCNKKGSDSLEDENWGAYNAIFDTCTQQKSDALEVAGYKCYYSDGASKSCRDVVCTTYKESACGSGVRSHNEYNIINPGNDPCGINVCQWFSSYAGCYKNADGNTERDCISDSSCEADYFMPNATLYPQINKGIYEKLSIDIWDRTSVNQEAAKITNPDYKTYLCIYPSSQEGSTACRSAGHPFVQYTNKLKLIVSNLNLFEEGNRNNNWSLAEWSNIIRYYSQDPSKNIGLINELTIEAHDNTTGPIVESINVSGSTKINNIFYTNIERPTITVRFYEPAIIVYQKITGASGAVQTPAASPANANSQEYSTIEFTPAANLGEGAYTFEFDAKNTNNIFLGNHSIKFVIDRQTATVNITPANGAILNSSLVGIIFKFNKNVTLTSVMLNQIDIKSNFSSDYNKEFRTTLALSDGSKSLAVNAKDYAGNIISGTSVFSVNALPPEINLTEPRNGVSPTYLFNITATTADNVPCRYYFSIGGSPPPTLPAGYNDWSAFSSEQGTKHKITGFSGIPVGDTAVHKFYVACNDPLWGVHSEVFDMSVDTTPPVILEAFADDIIQLPLNTTIYVQTDEDTMCRYDDNNVNYGNMRYLFPADAIPYRITHRQSKSVSSEGEYTVYVACENKAGLISSIQPVSFKVNLTVPLTLTDYTEPYSNETRITLSVGTNKDAYCYYGSSQNSISNWLGTSEKTRAHNQQLTNLAIGSHTYYARCNTGEGGEEKNIIITVSIDTTAPNMVYVNDTSTIADKPEYTWMTDKLRVKFLARDNETSVSYYQYLLEEFYSPYNRMVNWTTTNTEDNWFWVQGLNLSDDSKYNFRAKAKNIVGLTSGEMKSDGITIDTTMKPAHCDDGIKNGDETDVDCGGSCPPCLVIGYCGDNAIDAGEQCEGNDFGNLTCSDFDDFTGGTLTCGNDCRLKVSGCTGGTTGVCGDGKINTGEQCDKTKWGDITGCSDFDEFTGGTLVCNSNCAFDTNRCTGGSGSYCGDNAIDAGEQCEGNDFGNLTCSDFDDFTGGTLTCGNDCRLKVSGCTGGTTGVCGDGKINTGEQCDKTKWGDITGCSDFDEFTGGTLVCNSNCAFDTNRCDVPQLNCIDNSDCESDYCVSGKCVNPNCNDGVKQTINKETDIDCGGTNCGQCDAGKKCVDNSDCTTNYCNYGTCGTKDSCSDNKISSGETDIDCGGICPKGCSEGKSCDINSDCASTLECVSSICKLPVEEADTDGDGMPDDWETANELNPNNPDDAKIDSDEDILTNLEEYKYNTDPNDTDTDGDGFTDKEEIDAGTDPLDPNSYPKQKGGLGIFLLVLGILILLSGSGYLAYTYYYKPKKEKIIPRMPVPSKLAIKVPPPIKLAAPQEEKLKLEAIEKKKSEREEGKRKERESLFSKFATESKGETKEAAPEKAVKEKQEKTEKPEKAKYQKLKISGKLEKPEVSPTEPKQEKAKQKKAAQKRETAMPTKLKEGAKGRDVFRELSAIAKGREANKKTKEDTFKKLSAMHKKRIKE